MTTTDLERRGGAEVVTWGAQEFGVWWLVVYSTQKTTHLHVGELRVQLKAKTDDTSFRNTDRREHPAKKQKYEKHAFRVL